MDTLRVTKFDKVHVMNMEKDKVGTAESVTFCRFDDGYTDPPSRKWALQQYLTPYYQPQPTENRNFVVTKRETVLIDGKKQGSTLTSLVSEAGEGAGERSRTLHSSL